MVKFIENANESETVLNLDLFYKETRVISGDIELQITNYPKIIEDKIIDNISVRFWEGFEQINYELPAEYINPLIQQTKLTEEEREKFLLAVDLSILKAMLTVEQYERANRPN